MPGETAISVRKMAKACIARIPETLITEQRIREFPEFRLDEFQGRILSSTGRFLRVVAPAGSGKTRSLCAKAVDLLKANRDAAILCLTFTNAAADEFRQRIRSSGADSGRAVTVSTVNSFGYDVVKQSLEHHTLAAPNDLGGKSRACAAVKSLVANVPVISDAVGYAKYWEIVDLADLTKGFGFSHEDSEKEVADQYGLLERLRMAVVLEERLEGLDLIGPSMRTVFQTIWIPFWKRLLDQLWSSHLITMEDQKYRALYLLEREPRATSWLMRHGFTHVMVDEFQDINYLDLYLIAQIVTMSNSSLYIVGDDDQCIYEWRGCTSHFMRDPDKHLSFFLGGQRFSSILLELNYRCPRNIVQYASRVIERNQERLPKNIRAVRTDDANVRVVPLPSAYLTMHVVEELVSKIAKEHPTHTIAVLARKKCQLIPVHILLTKRGSEFFIDRDLNVFLGRAFGEFRAVMALPARYRTQASVSQIVADFFCVLDKLYKGPVNPREREFIRRYLERSQTQVLQTLENAVDRFALYGGDLKRGKVDPGVAASHLKRFLSCRSVDTSLRAASEVLKGFEQDFAKSKDDVFYSDPPFTYLADLALDYDEDYEGFLRDIDRVVMDAEEHSRKGAKVELMTALRGKGREFDTVILLDVNDGIWPNKMSVERGRMEEERRLFYVAISRTRCNLLLFESGAVQGQKFSPSPFLAEMGLPQEAWIRDQEIDKLAPYIMRTLRIEEGTLQ